MSCSLRKWVCDLSWMQQGVLLEAIRNCDGFDTNQSSPLKILVRGMCCACIKSAQSKGSFNARRPNLQRILLAADKYCKTEINNMPVHFVNHLMMAAEVIAYSHPDLKVRDTWGRVYLTMVEHLHLQPESFYNFKIRLSDDPEQVKRENKHDERCYTSGDYGDNNGTVNER